MSLLKGAAFYCGLNDYPLTETIDYIKKLKQSDIEFLFTSFHMPEQVGALDELKKVLKVTDELKLPVVVDVSPRVMGEFDLFKEVILRLDYGFSIEEIVKMSNEYALLELNASTLTQDYLEKLKELGANFSHLRVSHNFYPKRYTGLSIEDVKKKNELYHQYNLTVIGYLPSNSGKRPPLYQGLPTVEAHRTMKLSDAIIELVLAGCDGVCVGDAYMNDADLAILKCAHLEYICLPMKIYSNVPTEITSQLETVTRFRIDESPIMKRTGIKIKESIEVFNTIDPVLGSVTIDNKLLKRYMGEVDIFKMAVDNPGDMNVIGVLTEEAIQRLALIDNKQKIKLQIVGVIDE